MTPTAVRPPLCWPGALPSPSLLSPEGLSPGNLKFVKFEARFPGVLPSPECLRPVLAAPPDTIAHLAQIISAYAHEHLLHGTLFT